MEKLCNKAEGRGTNLLTCKSPGSPSLMNGCGGPFKKLSFHTRLACKGLGANKFTKNNVWECSVDFVGGQYFVISPSYFHRRMIVHRLSQCPI